MTLDKYSDSPDVDQSVMHIIQELSDAERQTYSRNLSRCRFAQEVNQTFREFPEHAKADGDPSEHPLRYEEVFKFAFLSLSDIHCRAFLYHDVVL